MITITFSALILFVTDTHYIPNPDNLPCVCHRDDNPQNNNADNIFWRTQQDNMKDMWNKGRTPKPWLGKLGKDNPNSIAVSNIGKTRQTKATVTISAIAIFLFSGKRR